MTSTGRIAEVLIELLEDGLLKPGDYDIVVQLSLREQRSFLSQYLGHSVFQNRCNDASAALRGVEDRDRGKKFLIRKALGDRLIDEHEARLLRTRRRGDVVAYLNHRQKEGGRR